MPIERLGFISAREMEDFLKPGGAADLSDTYLPSSEMSTFFRTLLDGADAEALRERLGLGNAKYLSDYPGSGASQVSAALQDLVSGDVLVFEPGVTTQIATAVSEEVPGGVIYVSYGHKFEFTASGAKLDIKGSLSSILSLTANYTKGSRTLTIAHTGVQLAGIERGTWIKVVSDALDGWNRNQGTQTNQYRLGEFAQVRKVVDNLDGTAVIHLWGPLKFVRGFTNTGDAELLTEGDTYTTANSARIIALLDTPPTWLGGTFEVQDADTHVGAGGWNNDMFTFRHYPGPVIRDVILGPGAGKALTLTGCPNFLVDGVRIERQPDFTEQSANDSITTSYIGYGVAIAGCWGGVVSNLIATDTRHGVTESNTTSTAASTSASLLIATGRTYGTRIVNPMVTGQYSSAVDTHHGAHAWTIANPMVSGVQGSYAINLRGPNHVVISPQISGECGIQVLSEYANSGGTDLPALVGNGDKWMSSATIIGGTIDCTYNAISASLSYVKVNGDLDIRCRTHLPFSFAGGVIDVTSGKVTAEITGETQAAVLFGDSTQRAIFYATDASSVYGITWTPSFIIREGAMVEIVGTAATDSVNMKVFGQTGTTAKVVLKGNLLVSLPSSGFASAFSDSIIYEYYNSAVVEFTGNTTISSAHPKWDQGRITVGTLAASTAFRLFSVRDYLGSATPFFATIRLFAVEAGAAALVAEYQVNESYGAASGTEFAYLLSGSTTDFEAGNNVDLSVTAPTVSKISVGYKDGGVKVRHEKAGVTYEDVFAEVTIRRLAA
jgi:hypothetical protein